MSDKEQLRGANTSCFVCGNDYNSDGHLEYCTNNPRNQDMVKANE